MGLRTKPSLSEGRPGRDRVLPVLDRGLRCQAFLILPPKESDVIPTCVRKGLPYWGSTKDLYSGTHALLRGDFSLIFPYFVGLALNTDFHPWPCVLSGGPSGGHLVPVTTPECSPMGLSFTVFFFFFWWDTMLHSPSDYFIQGQRGPGWGSGCRCQPSRWCVVSGKHSPSPPLLLCCFSFRLCFCHIFYKNFPQFLGPLTYLVWSQRDALSKGKGKGTRDGVGWGRRHGQKYCFFPVILWGQEKAVLEWS